MSNLRLEHGAGTQARMAWERAEAWRAELEALRIATAERVCGYAPCEKGVWLTPEDIQNGDPHEAFTVLDELPHYSTDLNACHAAQLRLVELGHGEKYREAMEVAWALGQHETLIGVWLLTAPAEARCQAMLSVLEGEK